MGCGSSSRNCGRADQTDAVTDTADLLLLAAAWAVYFAIHSALASLQVKAWVADRWPALAASYRLGYNVAAGLLLLVPLYLLYRSSGPALWAWRGWAGWVADGLALLAVLGFVRSTRWYDMAEFLGLRRAATGEAGRDAARLRISPFHRYVRHPWYFFGLVILWTRDMDPALLVTVVAVTLYLAVGAYLEERKLLVFHGHAYETYRRQVPGLVPLPWRHLSRKQARALEAEAMLHRVREGPDDA